MKLKSFAIAAVALAALATAQPDTASAKDNVGAAIAGGVIGGIIGGAIANQGPRPVYGAPVYVQPAPPVYVQPAPVYVQPAPVYVQPGYTPHQQWCMQRYRSYNPGTDTYFVRPGVPAYCNSPYR